jgi:hypothetical protein
MKEPSTDVRSVETSNQWMSSMRSPFINEMFNSFIPQKEFKFAFYNTIALILLGLVLSIMIAVYFILEPFLRPLLWALLCGSALHPFKQKLLLYLQNWIKDLRNDSRPITLGTILLPFSILNSLLDLMIGFIKNYYKLLISIPVSLLLVYFSISYLESLNNYFYDLIVSFIGFLVQFLSYLTSVNNTFIIITIIIAYLIAISFGWSDSTQKFLTFISPLIWFTVFVHIIALSGTLGYIISIILVSIIIIGLLKTSIGAQSHSSNDQIDGLAQFSLEFKSIIYKISIYMISLLSKHENDTQNESHDSTDQSVIDNSQTNTQREFASVSTSPTPPLNTSVSTISRRESANNIDVKHLSNTYLYTLLWTFLLVQIWFHRNLLYLSLIPIFLILLRIGWSYISSFLFNKIYLFNRFVEKRRNALLHPFIRHAYNYFLIGDKVVFIQLNSK